ncbi:MAG: PqqD family protein [bacterium]|nr:PqqD family protein [bacterium]
MGFTRHVKVRNEKFGSVIFETLKEKVYVSNQPGADILKLLGENKTEDEIVNLLAKKYAGDPVTVKNDVKEYISGLKQNNLIA